MAGGSRVRLATRRGQDAPSEAYVGVTPAIEGYAIHPIWFVSVPKLSRSPVAINQEGSSSRGHPGTHSSSRIASSSLTGHDAGRPEGVVIPAQLVLYIITLSLLKRWEDILFMLLALPLLAGSVFITILIAACNFFHDCL
jgi:hypothetical protein